MQTRNHVDTRPGVKGHFHVIFISTLPSPQPLNTCDSLEILNVIHIILIIKLSRIVSTIARYTKAYQSVVSLV